MKQKKKPESTQDDPCIAREPAATYHTKPQRNQLKKEQDEDREPTKQEVLDAIRQGLREVKAAERGEIELQTLEEFLHEIRNQAGPTV